MAKVVPKNVLDLCISDQTVQRNAKVLPNPTFLTVVLIACIVCAMHSIGKKRALSLKSEQKLFFVTTSINWYVRVDNEIMKSKKRLDTMQHF